jgi:6-phosphogluconolactonase (cycloisomerase 2 family)
LRVYSVDSKTLLLKEEEAIEVGAGSGPRHGAFLEKGGKTYYFLVTELSNETIVYRVTYGKGKFKKLSFEEVFRGGNFGPNPVPEGSAAAEVFVTVSFLLLSASRSPRRSVSIGLTSSLAGSEIPPNIISL